jgi:phosphopantetheine adenylyltransferase
MAPITKDEPSLLVIPALQLAANTSSLTSAYTITFETLVRKLVKPGTCNISRLDIAIILNPSYPSTDTISRTALFPSVKTLLASYYTLLVSSASKSNTDLDFPGGLDARIVILDPRDSPLSVQEIGKQHLSGPILDIPTFVASATNYSTIYSVEGETGEAHLKTLVTAWRSKHNKAPPIHRLPSGPSISISQTHSLSSQLTANNPDGPVTAHASVAVGGTFDHLHIGHKLLLTATILLADPTAPSRKITIGITGDELLVNKKYGNVVEPWETRQSRTAEFIESILVFHPKVETIKTVEQINEPGPNGKIVRVTYTLPSTSNHDQGQARSIMINYTQISDPFGPTITDEDISALVISGETRAGGQAVNEKRAEKGWKELEVFEVDVLDAGVVEEEIEGGGGGENEKKGFESKISSTEIRRRLQEGIHKM